MKTLTILLSALAAMAIGTAVYFGFRPRNKRQSDRDRMKNHIHSVGKNIREFGSRLQRTDQAA